MLLLFPLSKLTKESVPLLADIHIRSQQKVISKLFSDVIHICGKDTVTVKENSLDEKHFFLGKAPLLPPSKVPNPWSVWGAKNYFNAWWLIDYAYALNGEYKYRFGGDDTPDVIFIQELILANPKGLLLVPRPNTPGQALEDFPVVLPSIKDISSIMEKTPVEIYRNYYASIRGKVRMKWTKRTMPAFISGEVPQNDLPFDIQ